MFNDRFSKLSRLFALGLTISLCSGCSWFKSNSRDVSESAPTETAEESKVVEISTEAAFNEVKNKTYSIVDFYADWCPPCKMMLPIFEELSGDEKYKNIYFAKVNVGAAEAKISEDHNVMAIPVFIFFKDGKEVGRIEGFKAEDVFRKEIDKFFPDL